MRERWLIALRREAMQLKVEWGEGVLTRRGLLLMDMRPLSAKGKLPGPSIAT